MVYSLNIAGFSLIDLLRMCTLAGLVPAAIGAALAQRPADTARSLPGRAIKIVVPFPAGGPTDINARIIAQKMAQDWKQPVIIENRPGANTALGAQAAA